MNELTVQEQINALFSPEDIEMLERFEEIKTQVSIMTKERNKALLPIMEQYVQQTGESTLSNGRIKITYKKGYMRKSVDVDALKEQGLYDMFTKETEVGPSVSVGVEYE